MVTGSDNLDSYEALWFVSCECTIKLDGSIDDVLRELAELLGQVKPPVATREEIEKSGLQIIKPPELDHLEQQGNVASNCVERVRILLVHLAQHRHNASLVPHLSR